MNLPLGSSLLLTVTSKGPASSVSVFKTSGHNREAGSSLIYPISTYSLLKETKVNPHLPQIDQTHGDLVDDYGFLPGSVWSQSASVVNPQRYGSPGTRRLRTICSKESTPVNRCKEQWWLPQIRSGGSSTALPVLHNIWDTVTIPLSGSLREASSECGWMHLSMWN